MAFSTYIFVLIFLLRRLVFIQMLNKNGGRFCEDKKVSNQTRKEKQHKSLSVLARKINIEQVLVSDIREVTCFYFDLSKKVTWWELGVSS